MKRVLLDTNAYAALFRGEEEVLSVLGQANEVLLSAVVMGELHDGFRGGNRLQENLENLREFLSDPAVRSLAVTDETAEVFGRLKQGLRKAGTPIPMNDVWIAAHCLETGATLITYDHHFSQVAGLRVWRD